MSEILPGIVMPRASVLRCPRSGLIARLSQLRHPALTGPGLRGSFPGRNPHPILKAIFRLSSAQTGSNNAAESNKRKVNQ